MKRPYDFRETGAVEMNGIRNDASVCHKEQNSATLVDASSKGHSECVPKLVKAGVDVDEQVGDLLPVSAAAKNGHSSCLELLIHAGANVNKDFGQATLKNAVKGRHEKCVDILLRAGADVNGSTNTSIHTVLMVDVLGSTFEICKAIVETGADVNAITADGTTALNRAARYVRSCTIHIFKLLLKSGARVNITDRRSLNALMRLALSNLDRLGDDEGILLYAAGERVKVSLLQGYAAETIDLPDYMKPTLCLKHLCRRAITNHLLNIDEHNHLFGRIPRLGLPPSLLRNLLFNMSLGEWLCQ